ncbi:hypothetical protein KCU78_g2, partial [Aureobasidium melanogenum]
LSEFTSSGCGNFKSLACAWFDLGLRNGLPECLDSGRSDKARSDRDAFTIVIRIARFDLLLRLGDVLQDIMYLPLCNVFNLKSVVYLPATVLSEDDSGDESEFNCSLYWTTVNQIESTKIELAECLEIFSKHESSLRLKRTGTKVTAIFFETAVDCHVTIWPILSPSRSVWGSTNEAQVLVNLLRAVLTKTSTPGQAC